MKVNNAVIHQIIENPEFESDGSQLPFKLLPASGLHPPNDQMNILCGMLEKRLKEVGRGSSKFKNPNQEHGTPFHITNFINDDEDFLTFTTNLAMILESNTPRTATGSYIAFIDYELDDEDHLIVCALKLEEGVTIDADKMEVIEATSIQKKNIHEGAKINLGIINIHKEDKKCANYITWVKTNQSQKLSNYFQELFDIDALVDDKAKTTDFKKALDSYIENTVEASTLSDNNKKIVKDKLRDDAYEYINKVARESKPLDFEEINKLTDATLSTNEIEPERTFIEHVNEYHSSIPNLFKPYAGATKNWGKVRATVSNDNNKMIKLIIDREILNDEKYVDIDPENNEITIKHLKDSFFKDL